MTTQPNPTGKFHLGDILSITTGVLLSPDHMDGVYRILQFMTGEPLWTHQLPRAANECTPSLLEQFPQLVGIEVPELNGAAEAERWLAEAVTRLGEWFEVKPLNPKDHTSIEPVAELQMLRPGMKVLTVEVES